MCLSTAREGQRGRGKWRGSCLFSSSTHSKCRPKVCTPSLFLTHILFLSLSLSHTHTHTHIHTHTHAHSVFKVTTPEKKAKPRLATDKVKEEEAEADEEEEEEDEGEETRGSSQSSPEGPKEDYLRSTFESLSSEQAADAFFSRSSPNPHDIRLSISARFFSQTAK